MTKKTLREKLREKYGILDEECGVEDFQIDPKFLEEKVKEEEKRRKKQKVRCPRRERA